MKWTNIETGKTHGAFQHFMVALGDNADSVVERLNSDEAYAARLAAICHNGGFELSTSQARAREIMGKNFFGVEEAMKHFGAELSKRQIAYMSEIPFSEATLIACKDTHLLIAVTPISIIEMRAKVADVKLPKDQKRLVYKQDWYDSQAFANEKGQLEWRLIRKRPVSDSMSKNWKQQQALLDSKIEETPKAQVMVYAMLGYYLNTVDRLFENVWVRCSDLDSGGRRVCVGKFDAGGLGVRSHSDDIVGDSLGVASSRKLES